MSDRFIKRIQENRDLRERVKRREQEYASRVKTVREASDMANMDFWCPLCRKDFTGTGYKREGWVDGWPRAWYVGKCRCGKHAIRRITDKGGDRYYQQSFKIRFQRVRDYNDMLTPADDLFKIIYPHEYRKITSQL